MSKIVMFTGAAGGQVGVNPSWVARVDPVPAGMAENYSWKTPKGVELTRIWFGVSLHQEISDSGQDYADVVGDLASTVRTLNKGND